MTRRIVTTLIEFLAFTAIMGLLLMALIVSGCAPIEPLSAAESRAIEECEYEAARTSAGGDWINQVLRRQEVKQRCLRLKGYGR
jgi:hypothetical protein